MLNYTDKAARIHIISIYYGLNRRNVIWLRLQRKFIAETTTNYRFSVYLNGCDHSIFKNIDVIGSNPPANDLPLGLDHLRCLRKVRGLFDKSSSLFLILDSDCFPTMKGWHDILLNKMDGNWDKYEVAAPFRTENLEIYPHPSAVFMTRTGLEELNLDLTKKEDNLLGFAEGDPTFRNRCFPLIRTNRVNPHYLGAAIYYNMFYHHGAGSRPLRFKIYIIKYLQDRYSNNRLEEVFQKLVEDPKSLISSLK